MMFTVAIDAFSTKSAPPVVASTTTLNRHDAQQEAQQQISHSLSSRFVGGHHSAGLSERPTTTTTRRRKSSALAFSPTDIGDVATLVSLKVRGASSTAAISGGPAQVMSDASYVVMDPHKFFPEIKISQLRGQYALVFGRLMVLGTTCLLHQGQGVKNWSSSSSC